MDKSALRRFIGERKRRMSAAEIEARSAALAEKLFATEQYRRAESLYAYLSYNQEVRTEPIIRRAWADGKRVAVPKVVGADMRFIRLNDFARLRPNRFGILEPISDEAVDDAGALVLMPGLAFDRRGNRAGYGGGYYDRYLAAHPGHPTVALCYGFQLVERIDADDFDVPVDLVISDPQGPSG